MNLEEKLVAWSDGRRTTKFVAQGGEILKYIGGEMLMIKFHQGEDGGWTTDNPIPVFVVRIGDFDPLTGTYEMVYKEKDTGEEKLRITPEGFSWNLPETDGWMTRFVSYSNHFAIMEEELYYTNLRGKFNSGAGVLGPQEIAQFSEGKERKKRLGALNYISVVIDTDTENGTHCGILAFRISEVSGVDKRGKKWSVGVKDQDGDYIQISKFIENPETHSWYSPDFTINGRVLGDLKIIDIES